MVFKVGDKVKIERDEKKYPSKGSWSNYKGRIGTVVRVNKRDKEIGISFSTGSYISTDIKKVPTDAWFLEHELIKLVFPEQQT